MRIADRVIIDTEGREWSHKGESLQDWAFEGLPIPPWNLHTNDGSDCYVVENGSRYGFNRIVSLVNGGIHDLARGYSHERIPCPPHCHAEYNERRNIFRLWSFEENRTVLALTDCREVLRFGVDGWLISVISTQHHLQLRDWGNETICDFGPLPEGYTVRASASLHGGRELFIPAGVKADYPYIRALSGNMGDTFFAPHLVCYRCVDLQTGQAYGEAFHAIGLLNEGMRYLLRPDGSECFVDARGGHLFDLPASGSGRDWNMLNPIYSPLMSDACKSFFCVDGRITAKQYLQDKKTGKDIYRCILLDAQGGIIIPPENPYRSILHLGDGRLALIRRKDRKIAIADRDGTPMTDFIYSIPRGYLDWRYGYEDGAEGMGYFQNNRCAIAKLTDKGAFYGFIDRDCREVLPFEHSSVEVFRGGFCPVVRPR